MSSLVKTVHPQFSLLGASFTQEAVIDAGYSMIKEGEPYEKDIGDFIMDWVSDLPYITITTSGTTGIPTRYKVEKKAMVNSALATGKFFDLSPGDSCLLCLPASYIAGKMMLVRALVLGLDLHIVPPSSTPLLSTNKKFDFCAMIPMQVQKSLDQLGRIDKLIVGGAPLTKSLEEKIQNTTCTVYETFGMTETLTHIAVRTVYSPQKKKNGEEVFEAIPGVNFSTDPRGCLVIHAPHLQEEPVIPHDQVDLVSETQFKWLGRVDNVIYSGGLKLFPEAIESKLEPYIQSRYFIAGLPDDTLGEKLVLFVEGSTDTDALKNKLKEAAEFTMYEIPKEIIEVPNFPETSSGKIKRKAIVDKHK